MLRAAPLEVTVDGRVVRVTNPDRVLFPELGVTKADIVRYVLESATS
jgi:DNA primase